MTRRSPETVRFRDFFFCFRGGFTRRFSNTFLTLAGQQRGHFLGDGLLAGHVQVTIDIGGHLDITVAQPLLHVLERKAIAQQNAGTAMPLRYNNDKQKKPLFSRGLSVCRLLFNSFSKLKIDENYKEKRRLFY